MRRVCDAPSMGSSEPDPAESTREASDPSTSPARRLVEAQLADPDATWTMGPTGASVRFGRHPDEPVSRGPGSAVTDRAGIRILLPDEAVAIAYETPSDVDPLRWDHAVAFCLPAQAAGRADRHTITELGPDAGALRPRDTAAVLFDLGVAGPAAELLVRTADPSALAALRAAAGSALPDALGTLAPVLTSDVVSRVVRTVAGRIESGTPLRGPLTDLRAGPSLPPTAPVPDGWVPCAVLVPAHPAMDRNGRPTPFDRDRHAAFQALLTTHGDPVLGVLKAEVMGRVRANRGPEDALVLDDAAGRAAVAVAVRQLALTDGTSGTWVAWRSRFGV